MLALLDTRSVADDSVPLPAALARMAEEQRTAVESLIERALGHSPEALPPSLVSAWTRLALEFGLRAHEQHGDAVEVGDWLVERIGRHRAADGTDLAFASRQLARAWESMLELVTVMRRLVGADFIRAAATVVPANLDTPLAHGGLASPDGDAVTTAQLKLLVASELLLRGDERVHVWSRSAIRTTREARAWFDVEGRAELRHAVAQLRARSAHTRWDESDVEAELAPWPVRCRRRSANSGP